ncbi:AcrR family transcriptional regulator [Nocardioides luteus]|uniref:TetR family transcriptional regulator n=1 Tax=Nocardioides luteus TaxID=1844 RepID=A0ABQ5T3E9_9ACTN|nr:TetR/AcrR family transcriptional regulator [Nocardioides luteus]MDR7313738.1 AcrR family transcriptional regulator [Nocardioides luteus]GGR63690.1 TetR family transcriptional regulator [Nocardioides luteus]GLJ70413.1 TetR family transcriptional regulator [Nocardioides luteus]
MSQRTRLTPEQRREQLLDLGIRLFAHHSLDEMSIDLVAREAGISRGLLYHYFGDKTAFREAVVRRAAEALVAQTEPPATGEPVERLLHSMAAYVDFVDANYEGYVSMVRGAASDPVLREIYDDAFGALGGRIFEAAPDFVPDTPAARLVVRGWLAMSEELVLSWKKDPAGLSREDLLGLLAGSLPMLLDSLET